MITTSIFSAEFYGMITVPMHINAAPGTQLVAMPTPIRFTQALPFLSTIKTIHQAQFMPQNSKVAPEAIRLTQALPSPSPAYVNNSSEISEYGHDIDQEVQILVSAQNTYKMQAVPRESKSVEFMIPKQSSLKHQRRVKTAPLKRLFITQPAQDTTEQQPPTNVSITLITDQKENQPTTKNGLYCPFCNLHFINGPDAIAHSETDEHLARRHNMPHRDPEEYVRDNPEVLSRWQNAHL